MIIGLILILIVLIPFCIYLYLTNKKLLKKIENLEKERKIILERKLKINKDNDIYLLENISNKEEKKPLPKEKINLEELSKNIKKELENEPIKFTNYEQEQEATAIISYQELKEKNKLFRIDANDNPEVFIENLKEFRNNLNQKK